MSALFPGRITKLEIGTTDATNVDITNVVLFHWERDHGVRPRLYANLKYPTTYQQPHSWITGTFSLLSDHHAAIYATDVQAAVGNQYAMVETGDSNVIDFFQITYEDEDGSLRTTRFYYAIIYRYVKEILNYDDSVWVYHFMAGYAVDDPTPTPPAPDYLMSVDSTAVSIYIHVGETSTISTSFSAPAAAPYGLTLDSSNNLISSSTDSVSIYIHVGITSTVSTSFSAPDDTPSGLTVNSTGNLISTGGFTQSIFIHVGITNVISTSFSSPAAGPRGITLDSSGNLISCDGVSDSIYIHVGITSVISTSFSSPGGQPRGLTLDDSGNLISSDSTSDSIYIHVGITSTISTSFSSPSTSVMDLTF